MTERWTYGSAFSGIGGLDVAVERVFGARPVWHVEPDPYAAAVLAHRWPGVTNHGRIEHVDKRAQRPDIICGGFPCQDISLAGNGAGLDGARSGLWWELARTIGTLRPGIVVLENVAALAARGLDVVVGELSRLGYDAAWSVVRASDVGAPHLRARMFIVAVAGSLSDADREHLWQEREREGPRGAAEGLAGGDGEELVDPNDSRRQQQGQPAQETPGRGISANPGGAEVVAHGDSRGPARERKHGLREGVSVHGEASERGDDPLGCDGEARWPPAPGDSEGWARWPGALPGVRRGTYGPTRGVDARRRRARLKCLGNAVVPAQAEHAIRGMVKRLTDS